MTLSRGEKVEEKEELAVVLLKTREQNILSAVY